jgi:hypothetical protein
VRHTAWGDVDEEDVPGQLTLDDMFEENPADEDDPRPELERGPSG